MKFMKVMKAVFGESLVKDVKEWKLLEKNANFIVEQATNDMKSYIQPEISKTPK